MTKNINSKNTLFLRRFELNILSPMVISIEYFFDIFTSSKVSMKTFADKAVYIKNLKDFKDVKYQKIFKLSDYAAMFILYFYLK